MKKNHLLPAIKLIKLLLINLKANIILSVLLCILAGLLTGGNVLVKQIFFAGIENVCRGETVSYTILLSVLLGMYTLLMLFFQGISDIMMEDLRVRVGGVLGSLINKKAAKFDPIYYENTHMLNFINQVRMGVDKTAEAIKILIIMVAYYIPYFFFFTYYFYNIHPVLSVIMLLMLMPTIFGQYVRSKYYAHFENNVISLRRKIEYYMRCIVGREYAKETRIWGATNFFRSLYQKTLGLYKKEAWIAERRSSFVELGLRFISLIVYIIIILLMFYFTLTGILGLAAFIAVLSSLDQMFNLMDYMGDSIGEISSTIPSLINTLDFFCIIEKPKQKKELYGTNIRFENVSFYYPCNKTPALKNVSFLINSGETIAIVGTNGSGKSTMAKLILGIFTPTTGHVYIGDDSTSDISRKELFKKCSAVFQNFQRYKMTLKQNVQISELGKRVEDCCVLNKLKNVDINANSAWFPEGIRTMLSKEFGGVDLSGGQWQRVAIARGIYRNHQIIVLDEPTAAIDPLEETKMYRKFAEISKEKTAIIITHRIGAARIADKIIVMDNGEMVGYGTHDELMKQNEYYQAMFYSQAQWYQ